MSDNIIIRVPAGKGHQEYNSIFRPSILNLPRNKTVERWGISLCPSLLPEGLKLPTKFNKATGREYVRIDSQRAPLIATKLEHDSAGICSQARTWEFFDSIEKSIKYTPLTLDMVTRYVSKSVIFKVVHGSALLLGVRFIQEEVSDKAALTVCEILSDLDR